MKTVLPQSLHQECIKCAKIVRSFSQVGTGIQGQGFPTDQFIPLDIFSRAKGIAILRVVKAGFLWAGKAGSGLVLARLPNGNWSAPSAINTAGVSFGGQIGAEMTDFLILLNSDAAVKAFAQSGNVTLGGNLSVAAGPYGRTGEVSGTAKNTAAIYSYSKSKGLFAGVSIEGSVIVERTEANDKFYGNKVTAKQILSGEIPVPATANDLLAALKELSASKQTSAYATLDSSASLVTPLDSTQAVVTNGSKRPVPPLPLTQKPIVSHQQWNSTGITPTTATAGFMPSTTATGNTLNSTGSGPMPGTTTSGFMPNTTASGNALPTNATGFKPTTTGNAHMSNTDPYPPINSSNIHYSTHAVVQDHTGSSTAVALFDFTAQNEGDLSFRAGDLITVLNRGDNVNQWWYGRFNNHEGSFPANYVELKKGVGHYA